MNELIFPEWVDDLIDDLELDGIYGFAFSLTNVVEDQYIYEISDGFNELYAFHHSVINKANQHILYTIVEDNYSSDEIRFFGDEICIKKHHATLNIKLHYYKISFKKKSSQDYILIINPNTCNYLTYSLSGFPLVRKLKSELVYSEIIAIKPMEYYPTYDNFLTIIKNDECSTNT